MIHEISSEALRNFAKLRIFSIARMNAFALISNRNKSLTSLAKNYEVSFPLGISEDLPTDVALEIASSTKIDVAMKIKSLIENMTFDSAQDAALNNVLSFLPIKRSGGISAISVPDLVGEGTAHFVITEAMKAANALGIRELDILEADNKAAFQNDNAHPLYINVEIPYITGNDEVKYVKSTIGVNIVIKKVKAVDLKLVIREHDPAKLAKSYMKATGKEGSFVKDFLLDLDNIKKTAEMNVNKETLLSVVKKEKIRLDIGSGYVYPFTLFAVSDQFVATCKEDINVDLRDTNDLKMTMKGLLALGFFIYSTNDSLTYMYDGDATTSTVMMSDFSSAASKYEKEIAQMIRLK